MRLLGEIRNYLGNYHVKSGVYHYYRNEFSQAVGFLRKALNDEATLGAGDRRHARSYLTLALKGLAGKLADNGEVDEALEQLRAAAEMDPTYPDIHYLRGRYLERLDRHADAVEAYRESIERHPRYLDAMVALGNCLIAAGRPDEAAEVFGRAMELKLDTLRKPLQQGLQFLQTGKPEDARECFHQVFSAAPQLSREHLSKALEWIRAEEWDRALIDVDRALELNPKYPDLHNFRGIVLCELESYDEALAAFRRSAELRPEHVVPRLNLAFTLLRAGRNEEGESELAAIAAGNPEEAVARSRLEELRASRIAEKRGGDGRS